MNNGKAPMMRALAKSSKEHEMSPGYTSCGVFQQPIECRSVMSTRSPFRNKHLRIRELRKKGVLGSAARARVVLCPPMFLAHLEVFNIAHGVC
jgi:hypothetical protein